MLNARLQARSNVTFNQDMEDSSFTAAQVLSIIGPAGPIGLALPKTFSAGNVNQTIPAGTGQPLVSSIAIPMDNGSFPLQDLTITLNITAQTDSDIEAILVGPGATPGSTTQVVLFNGVGGAGSNFINTTLDDAAAKAIGSGSAPFTGTFQPSQSLSAFFGHDLAADQLDSTWSLELFDNAPNNTAALNSWSLSATPTLSVTPFNDGTEPGTSRTFAVNFPLQVLSGTYTVQLASTIASAPNAAAGIPSYELDSNLNAGVYNLLQYAAPGQTTTITQSATTPLVFPPGTTPITYNSGSQLSIPAGGTLTSSITIGDSYLIQGETLQLSILDNSDPFLSAVLIPPPNAAAALGLSAGEGIPLFANVGATGTPERTS